VKIAIVHPYLVHLRAVGGTTRVYALVRHLAGRHTVEVLTHASGDPDADRAAADDLAQLGAVHRTFERPRATTPRKLSWMLSPEPYFVGHNLNPALASYLAERDRAGEIDLVHVEFSYLEPMLAGLGARPARILAEQETMSLMIERLRSVPGALKSAYQLYIARELRAVRRFERAVLPRFDRAFAITPQEAGRRRGSSARSSGDPRRSSLTSSTRARSRHPSPSRPRRSASSSATSRTTRTCTRSTGFSSMPGPRSAPRDPTSASRSSARGFPRRPRATPWPRESSRAAASRTSRTAIAAPPSS
jgi:hypothetical protein